MKKRAIPGTFCSDHPIQRSDHPIARSPDHPIRDKLLGWFQAQRRELPWRGSKDPYRIWVSEVMLQQTTVGAVLPRYLPFIERFPDVGSLARASEESVVAEWSGLGYYSRARNLHRAARVLVAEHRGELPRDPEALVELPGFGEYMAAAVASLAFGARAPAADANVTRILSRLHAIAGPSASRGHRRRVLDAAAALLPDRDPGDLIAAFMDLGQTICLPRRPRCGICPLVGECAAAREGAPERYPERPKLGPVVRVSYAAAHLESRGRVWLVRRPPGSWLAGTWSFPAEEGEAPDAARRLLARDLRRRGLVLGRGEAEARAAHTIMRRRLDVEIFPARFARPGAGPSGGRCFTRGELERAAASTLTRKIASAIGFLPRSKRAYP